MNRNYFSFRRQCIHAWRESSHDTMPSRHFALRVRPNVPPWFPQIPHVKIGPEETPKLPYLRFASVSLYPSNEDLSLAIGSILRSFGYPTASLICAKAECESAECVCVCLCVWVSVCVCV